MKIPARPIYFRGFKVGMLKDNERVATATLIRNGQEVWTKDVQKLANPYSDDHAELVLEEEEMHKGDLIRFKVMLRQDQTPKRSERELEFSLP